MADWLLIALCIVMLVIIVGMAIFGLGLAAGTLPR